MVRRAARVLYFYHYLANRFLTFLSNLLTNRNMTDIKTCYKAFRAGVIKPLQLTSSGFGMEVEITAMICKTAARTYEVPISYYGRTYEEGKKIGICDGLAALLLHRLLQPCAAVHGRQPGTETGQRALAEAARCRRAWQLATGAVRQWPQSPSPLQGANRFPNVASKSRS